VNIFYNLCITPCLYFVIFSKNKKMKKNNLFTFLAFILFVSYVSQSCQKDTTTEEPEEFVATNATFSDFATWTLESTKTGPGAKLGAAHAGNDTTVSRKIYFKDGQDPVNGTYPTGTVIVKHTSNPAGSIAEYTAMVKRGNEGIHS
jgi:hypothetical protein